MRPLLRSAGGFFQMPYHRGTLFPSPAVEEREQIGDHGSGSGNGIARDSTTWCRQTRKPSGLILEHYNSLADQRAKEEDWVEGPRQAVR